MLIVLVQPHSRCRLHWTSATGHIRRADDGSTFFRPVLSMKRVIEGSLQITNYRTATTGIEPHHLTGHDAMPFDTVQQLVANLISGKILVGHSLWNDLSGV